MNARANNLGIFYPIIPSERIKTRAMLDIRHAQYGDQNHPALRSARYFRLSEQAQNISVFQSQWKSRSFLYMNAPIVCINIPGLWIHFCQVFGNVFLVIIFPLKVIWSVRKGSEIFRENSHLFDFHLKAYYVCRVT